ncbi:MULTISPECIES: efflux RND transporter permease subunit [unclassified Burkholderia]|uniref:efflux RND transporter permease subunit n=1 Tax=unclassified Burkholderia TaxID=2613784 RepID=UPI00141DBE87|nr:MULTISPECIES: efflux RND transporter permease subunit [unclassified Burkholderia]NIE82841.1 efflux RND transporter permease subunit [Burkholderia sp. Tr-860]NIF61547.1 efflux RND transporter permease subunit [Burkholderia sp. Cy-647]NIF94760.1 efflux RND transporter permease subunit [Burkholderia sp. Ax-1720]
MARFFIDRPILAWVIACVLMIAGALALRSMPIEQYPSVAPPVIQVVATYPGASADTVAANVTQVIEQSLSGIDHLLYMSSSSSNAGQATIALTLAPGANPDIAQMQVQNKVSQVSASLPLVVEQQGINISKASSNFLMVVSLSSRSGRLNSIELGNLLASQLQDPISEINGVGGVNLFSPQHAMRIWLNPVKLHSFGLTASDVTTAIANQNVETSVGELGGTPATASQAINATITASSLMRSAEQFGNILLRVNTSGSRVLLKDVARVEVGGDTYDISSRMGGRPAAALAVQLATGANAMAVASAVRARVDELRLQLPTDVEVDYPFDTTPFVRVSMVDVVQTLVESVILVFLVMLVFLRSVRATLIPAVVIPIALLGTCVVLWAAGMSLNVLSMFAVVLAIGLLVDDAIVVVENVDRIMREQGLGPREATRKAMKQITGALVGITTVLTAVFIPMAFFSGSTGGIYRQFSVTIVAAMVLSLLLALSLTPALCATLLRPPGADATARRGRGGRFIEQGIERYRGWLAAFLARPRRFLLLFSVILAVLAWLMARLPTSYLPDEDQGVLVVLISTPAGTPIAVTDRTVRLAEDYFLHHEAATDKVLAIDGYSFNGQGQNNAILFVSLKDWSRRRGADQQAGAIMSRANAHFSSLRDAQVFAVNLPAIPSLGNQSGLDFEIEDRAGQGHEKLLQARNLLMSLAASNPALSQTHPAGLDDTPQFHIDIDREKAGALGLSISDINDTLQIAFGSSYVNNYVDNGRIQRVFVQADAPYRMMPDDIGRWYVRTSAANGEVLQPGSTPSNFDGQMVPLSAFSSTRWTFGSPQIERYNHMLAMEMTAQTGPGFSTGGAMQAIESIAARLPRGFSVEWTGQSYQEVLSNSQSLYLYGISIVIVFLCLAGLYESWGMPIAVLLVVPLGALGAVLAVTLRGMPNDIYFKVGLLTTIGLATKNAILIVEFAKELHEQGRDLLDAALEAARLRVKPILMTSIAFVFGVLPLVFSGGAGAESRRAIGTAVAGGMLGATVLAVFYVPLFFILVRKLFKERGRHADAGTPPEAEA